MGWKPWLSFTAMLALMLALSGCGDASVSRQAITAVGSSTVYPFAASAAELLVEANPDIGTPRIESTGTGGGIERFCRGIGAATPDIVNASRRMKRSEFDKCQGNGAGDIIELQIGIDGLVIAQARGAVPIRLTRAQIYRAMAANPGGRRNQARRWSDVDPSLPATPISILSPPSTSGTFDAFRELILTPGCEADPAMVALRQSNPERHDSLCHNLRGAPFVLEQGENDNLIVQKLVRNPAALGIFGYSYLEANADVLHDVAIEGVDASPVDILSGRYPGARPLYLYVKRSHLPVIPGLADYLDVLMTAARPGGPLERRGMIALHPADYAAMRARLAVRTPLDPAVLR